MGVPGPLHGLTVVQDESVHQQVQLDSDWIEVVGECRTCPKKCGNRLEGYFMVVFSKIVLFLRIELASKMNIKIHCSSENNIFNYTYY